MWPSKWNIKTSGIEKKSNWNYKRRCQRCNNNHNNNIPANYIYTIY
jgi:hypothetical protein